MSDSTIRFHDYSALTFGKPQLFDELKTKLNKKNYKEGTLFLIDKVDIDDTKKRLERVGVCRTVTHTTILSYHHYQNQQPH